MGFKLDGKAVSDIILGISDGLTVPFALSGTSWGDRSKQGCAGRRLGRISSSWHLNGSGGLLSSEEPSSLTAGAAYALVKLLAGHYKVK